MSLQKIAIELEKEFNKLGKSNSNPQTALNKAKVADAISRTYRTEMIFRDKANLPINSKTMPNVVTNKNN